MSKSLLFAAGIAVLAVSAAPAAFAQGGNSNQSGAGAAPQLTPEQEADVRRAAQIQRAFSEALRSDQVSQPVKGALLLCLYNNSLSTIGEATEQFLTSNPELKATDPTTVYRAAAGVCGVTFRPVNGAGAAGNGAASAPPANNSQGR